MPQAIVEKGKTETDFQPIYAWPPVSARQWQSLETVLAEKAHLKEVSADVIDLEAKEGYSVIHIAHAVTQNHPQRPDELDYLETVANTLGVRQLRYGIKAGNYYVGLSGPLSEAEAELCRSNMLWQHIGSKAVTELVPNEVDNSQTLRSGEGRYMSDPDDEYLRALHKRVVRKIAPYLDHGVALTTERVTMASQRHESLFRP